MSRTDPQLNFRIPAELREKLEAAAKNNNRSLTGELIARLQATFDETVVTTVEARVRPGAEEKRFEFNADEIADKVIARLEGRERKSANKVIIRGKDAPGFPISAEALEAMYGRLLRVLEPSPSLPPRNNEPHGPQKSSNAKRSPPKRTK